jgi:hypothetical protein
VDLTDCSLIRGFTGSWVFWSVGFLEREFGGFVYLAGGVFLWGLSAHGLFLVCRFCRFASFCSLQFVDLVDLLVRAGGLGGSAGSDSWIWWIHLVHERDVNPT